MVGVLVGLIVFYLVVFGITYLATNLAKAYQIYKEAELLEEKTEYKSQKQEKQVKKVFDKTLGVWRVE